MPHRDRTEHNAYMREYNRARWERRRRCLIEMLGGCCVHCGTTESLEFDHIDPATKSFDISRRPLSPWKSLVREAQKCQLLCRPCHIERSRTQIGVALRGEANGAAMLTEDDVRAIRAEYQMGKFGYVRLAHRYGVNKSTIRRIVLRESWGHVT